MTNKLERDSESSEEEMESGTGSGSESEEDNSMGLHDIDIDSDEELQEAFAAGLIKPGLNRVFEDKKKKNPINDVNGLKQKLDEFKLTNLAWIERLDMSNKMAPLAPELAFKKDQIDKKNKKNGEVENLVENDFEREMSFYRQAQAAVLEAVPRLRSLNVKTKRPEDYFAQMAKSDKHMQKIREKLVSKEVAEERLEKIRKLRDLKKFGKKVQIEVQQKRQKEKKDMLDQVKKFRKGQANTIDFLDDEFSSKISKNKSESEKRISQAKRKGKDQKFGFGGKKKGMKSNTKDSVNDTSGYRNPKGKRGGKKTMGAKLKTKRLGKARRNNMKNKK